MSGLAGLGAGALLTWVTAWLATDDVLPRLAPAGAPTWALLGFVLFFSLAEMPLMIFGLRRMAGSSRTIAAARLTMLTTSAFVFFAAVYAAAFTLLTGQTGLGAALAGLCLARFAGVVLLVPGLGDWRRIKRE